MNPHLVFALGALLVVFPVGLMIAFLSKGNPVGSTLPPFCLVATFTAAMVLLFAFGVFILVNL